MLDKLGDAVLLSIGGVAKIDSLKDHLVGGSFLPHSPIHLWFINELDNRNSTQYLQPQFHISWVWYLLFGNEITYWTEGIVAFGL